MYEFHRRYCATLTLPKKSISKNLVSIATICLLLVEIFMVISPVSAESLLTLKWSKRIESGDWYTRTHIGPLAADIDADGQMEIVVTGGSAEDGKNGSVTMLKGSTGQIIWRASPLYNGSMYSGIGFHTPFDLLDVNNDGIMEIIMTPGNPLVLFGNNGSVYWRNNAVPADNNYPAEYDIDADGYPEIFVDSGKGPTQGVDYITSLTFDGKILHQAPTWHPCWGGLTIGDPNFNGTFILYEGDRNRDYNPPEDPYNSSFPNMGGWGIRAIDANTLTPLWNDSTIIDSSHCPMLADVNRDGVLDVITGDQAATGIAVYKWNGVVIKKGGTDMPVHSQPTVYDVDGDGHLELIDSRHDNDTNTGSPPKIWDLVSWKLDAELPVLCDEPPKLGDIDGDGKLEIIAVEWGGIHVFKYNGSGYDEIATVSNLQGANAFTLVQDVDGDDLNELILSSMEGYVYVFDTPAPAPIPRVRSNLQFYSEYKLGAAEYVEFPGPRNPQIIFPSPKDGATKVPITLSELSFRLTDYQKDSMNYTVTTVPDVVSGGATGLNVGNGRYAVPVSSLKEGITYKWTVTATDGTHTNVKTFIFKIETRQPWWNPSWQYRKRITINASEVQSDQINFPVLIDTTDVNLTKARSDGYDFAFVDENNVKLDHEIQAYDDATGHLIAWIRIPLLSSAEDTIFYMYYGNSNAENQQNKADVWDTKYKMVLHLDQESGVQFDSTVNGNNGSSYGALSTGVSGKIDGSVSLDGKSGYLEVPHSDTLAGFTTGFTVSFWVKLDTTARRQTLLTKYMTGSDNQKAWYIDFENDASMGKVLGFFVSSDGATYSNWYARFNPTIGVWYYVVVVWESNLVPRFYVNGVKVATINSGKTSSIYNNVGLPLDVGKCPYDSTRYFDGALDEIRISSQARSVNWTLIDYNNQMDPSSFCDFGVEEVPYVPPEPIISDPFPLDGATGVDFNPVLSANITDYQGDLLTVVFRTNATGTWQDLGSYVGGNGVYAQPTSNMNQYGTTYWWKVIASDGAHQSNQMYNFRTKPEMGNWWNASWQYRRTVTIDHARVSEDQNGFPVLIDFTDSSLIGKPRPNGYDFVFVDVNNAKLYHEIESYQSTTGHLVAWVKIPSLSSTEDTTVYMYYGNPTSEDQQNAKPVWNSDFAMVQHFEEASGTRYDSTGNANLSPYGGVGKSTSGKIDGADSFDGVNDYEKNSGMTLYGQNSILIESWVYVSGRPPVSRYAKSHMYGRKLSSGDWFGLYISTPTGTSISNFNLVVRLYNPGTGKIKSFSYTVTLLDQWVHIAWGVSKATGRTYFYVNGVLMRSDDISSYLSSGYITPLDDALVKGFTVGSGITGWDFTKLTNDELRISRVIRSAGWMLTCYNNQNDPSGFCTIGPEEIRPS